MTKKAHIEVYGRVQGVFYRYSTMQKATELGLVGWVRNLSGGSVEIVCEGQEDIVEQFIAWCREGPPGARVEQLNIRWETPHGDFKDFHIKY